VVELLCKLIIIVIIKLDAGQRPTLARPAAPLAAWVWQQQKLVAVATFFGSKTDFRLTVYSHSSTNPENLAKIGLVNFEIIGLAGIANISNN